MISNPLKNFPWIVLNITPGALCHTRWISRQNHTVHYRVLNRTLNSDWMVPNKVQVRCDREAVYKSTVNFWFEKSSRDIEDFGKDCKFRKITLISIMLFINISISLWFLEQDSAPVEESPNNSLVSILSPSGKTLLWGWFRRVASRTWTQDPGSEAQTEL